MFNFVYRPTFTRMFEIHWLVWHNASNSADR